MTEITIKPFSAQLTRDVDTFSTMDPYCKVMVGSNFQRTPTHKNGGKSPSWQCTLTFNRTIETAIKFEVWDSNTGKDQLIGEGTLDWNYAFANGQTHFNDWVNLNHKGKSAGKVLVEMQLGGNQQFQQQQFQQQNFQQQNFQQQNFQQQNFQQQNFQQQSMFQPQQQMYMQQPMMQQQFVQQPIYQQPLIQQPIIQQPMLIQQQPQVMFTQPNVIVQPQPTVIYQQFPNQQFF